MHNSKIISFGAFFLCSLFLHPLYSSPVLGNCEIFPANNIWNTPIDTLPVHPLSEAYVRSIGIQKKLKADFGSGLWEGNRSEFRLSSFRRLPPFPYPSNTRKKASRGHIQFRITHRSKAEKQATETDMFLYWNKKRVSYTNYTRREKRKSPGPQYPERSSI